MEAPLPRAGLSKLTTGSASYQPPDQPSQQAKPKHGRTGTRPAVDGGRCHLGPMSVSNVALSHLAIADLAIVLPDFVAELRGQHR